MHPRRGLPAGAVRLEPAIEMSYTVALVADEVSPTHRYAQ